MDASPAQRGVTLRAIILGAMWMLFLSFVIPYNDYKIQSTFITGNHFPLGAVLILALLVLGVNMLWRVEVFRGEMLVLVMLACGAGFYGTVLRKPDVLASSRLLFLACAWLLLTRLGKAWSPGLRSRVANYAVLAGSFLVALAWLYEKSDILVPAMLVLGALGACLAWEYARRREGDFEAALLGGVGAGFLLARAICSLIPPDCTGYFLRELIFELRVTEPVTSILSPPGWRWGHCVALVATAAFVAWALVLRRSASPRPEGSEPEEDPAVEEERGGRPTPWLPEALGWGGLGALFVYAYHEDMLHAAWAFLLLACAEGARLIEGALEERKKEALWAVPVFFGSLGAGLLAALAISPSTETHFLRFAPSALAQPGLVLGMVLLGGSVAVVSLGAYLSRTRPKAMALLGAGVVAVAALGGLYLSRGREEAAELRRLPAPFLCSMAPGAEPRARAVMLLARGEFDRAEVPARGDAWLASLISRARATDEEDKARALIDRMEGARGEAEKEELAAELVADYANTVEFFESASSVARYAPSMPRTSRPERQLLDAAEREFLARVGRGDYEGARKWTSSRKRNELAAAAVSLEALIEEARASVARLAGAEIEAAGVRGKLVRCLGERLVFRRADWTKAVAAGFLAAVVFFGGMGAARFSRSRRPLGARELIVVFILLLAGSGIPSSGLVRYVYPYMVSPFYLANSRNAWESKLHPYIPSWLVPSKDRRSEVVVKFYEGFRADELAREGKTIWEAIPWEKWVGPTAAWLAFISLCYFMMLCLSALLRRQWEETEKISFPLARVPLEMTENPEPGKALNRFFRNPVMWAGAAIPIFVYAINGLHNIHSEVPYFDTVINLHDLFRKWPWYMMQWGGWVQMYLYFTVIGFVYLLPLEVSLSLWFFYVFSQLLLVVGGYFGLTVDGQPWQYVLPMHQQLGAYLAFAAFMVWASRRHIASIVKGLSDEWNPPPWGEALIWLAAPGVFAWMLLSGASTPETFAAALVYLFAVPVGRMCSRKGFTSFVGAGTAVAAFGVLQWGWSPLAMVLAGLIEARRKGRAETEAGTREGGITPMAFAVGTPLVFVMALWLRTELWLSVLVTLLYFVGLPLPRLLRARGMERAALAVEAATPAALLAGGGYALGRADLSMTVAAAYALLVTAPGLVGVCLREGRRVDDSSETMGYRTAVTGLVGSWLLVSYMAERLVGMSFGVAFLAVGVLLLTVTVLSRIVAQGGMLFVLQYFRIVDPFLAFGGAKALCVTDATPAVGARNVVMLKWLDGFFFHDMRETIMPSMMNSFKMGGSREIAPRKVLWLIVLSIIVAISLSSVIRVYTCYEYGALSLRYHAIRDEEGVFRTAARILDSPPEFTFGKAAATVWGAGLMATLAFLASRFYWWPLHPIGLLLFHSWAIHQCWWSIFLGWLFKWGIVTYGGGAAFKRMRPFFLGLILGDCLIGGLWIGVGLIMGEKVLSILPG